MDRHDFFKNTRAVLDRIDDAINGEIQLKELDFFDKVAADTPALLIASALYQDMSPSFCQELGKILLSISKEDFHT